MEAEEIDKIVNKELRRLAADVNRTEIDINWLRSVAVRPYTRMFVDPVSNVREKYWVVLDEDRNSSDNGYLIIYSESDGAFGIATKSNTIGAETSGTLIGIFGSLEDAIRSL